jgi:hypothetical protein
VTVTVKVLYNVRLFTGGADLTAASNKVVFGADREEKDVTTFLPASDPDSGWKKVTGGLASGAVAASGFWEAGDAGKVDNSTWTNLGGLTGWTVCPADATVGAPAYLMKAMTGKYQFLGTVGDINPYEAEAKSAWPIVRGVVAHPPGTARTANGSGTASELTAVTATQNLYASLHVLSVSGTSSPTLTVIVESDVDGLFGSPATRATFTAATAISGQITRVPGAITDTFYRVSWTITGTNPSFLFAVSLGIA